jgi:hypothetical protein
MFCALEVVAKNRALGTNGSIDALKDPEGPEEIAESLITINL